MFYIFKQFLHSGPQTVQLDVCPVGLSQLYLWHCLELSGEQRTYIMVLCCCGNKNDQVDDPEDEGGGPEGGEVGGLSNLIAVLKKLIFPFSAENSAQPSLNQMFYSRLGRVEKFKHGSKNFFILFSIYSFGVWMFAITYRVANTADFNSRGGTLSLSFLSPNVNFTSVVYSGIFFFSAHPSLR